MIGGHSLASGIVLTALHLSPSSSFYRLTFLHFLSCFVHVFFHHSPTPIHETFSSVNPFIYSFSSLLCLFISSFFALHPSSFFLLKYMLSFSPPLQVFSKLSVYSDEEWRLKTELHPPDVEGSSSRRAWCLNKLWGAHKWCRVISDQRNGGDGRMKMKGFPNKEENWTSRSSSFLCPQTGSMSDDHGPNCEKLKWASNFCFFCHLLLFSFTAKYLL